MSGEAGSDVFLYWGSGSPPCWRVMLALEEKGLLGYKHKLLSFAEKEHKSEEVLKLNPRGQLPTTQIGDQVINESLAAIDYIEAVNPAKGTALHPSEPASLAKVLQRKYEALNFHSKGVEGLVFPLFTGKQPSEERKQAFNEEVNIWEGYLKNEGEGSYVAGKNFSMADVVFFPSLAFLVRMGFKLLPRYPSLNGYYNLVSQREAVQKTWPPHWKESEASSMLGDL